MGAEIMAERKRMGGMKLGQFGGVKPQPTPELEPEPIAVLEVPEALLEVAKPDPQPTAKAKRKRKEPLSTLNIKVPRAQQRWLQDTAQQVRDNNAEAVPPDQRVYPQHLIQIAIDLLQAQDVNWEAIHNIDELRNTLNL
jgi:hypothetical protein